MAKLSNVMHNSLTSFTILSNMCVVYLGLASQSHLPLNVKGALSWTSQPHDIWGLRAFHMRQKNKCRVSIKMARFMIWINLPRNGLRIDFIFFFIHTPHIEGSKYAMDQSRNFIQRLWRFGEKCHEVIFLHHLINKIKYKLASVFD